MSSADLAVLALGKLENEDLRILNVIEAAMSKREFVPKEQVQKYAKVPMDRIEYILGKLNKLGLIYQMRGAYEGHTLNYVAYDCLALNTLVKSGIITSFGQTIGVGKEADVYTALSATGKPLAVKFHRLGRISFRQTRRKRGYAREHSSWLFQSHIAAEREFNGLKIAFENGVSVPEPISQNRHVIVMGIIEGGELSKWRKIENPSKVLREILRNVKKAYLKAHIIHGDLSEYNIILKPDMHILIIDWPQYVLADHPNAQELLKRDVQNVITFFRRRFKVKAEATDAFNFVTGKSAKLSV